MRCVSDDGDWPEITVSQAYVNQLESGVTTNPSYEVLIALSEIYGTPYSELIGELVADKYHVERASVHQLTMGACELDSFWEREVGHDGKSLWIAWPRPFKDDWGFLAELVCSKLRSGSRITFFSQAADSVNVLPDYLRLQFSREGLQHLIDEKVQYQDLPGSEFSLTGFLFVGAEEAIVGSHDEPRGYLAISRTSEPPYLLPMDTKTVRAKARDMVVKAPELLSPAEKDS